MNDQSDSLQEALHALEVMFAAKLPSKLLEIEDALNQFILQPKNTETLALLHRLLHNMSGSAGTFGFDELGVQSRRLELRLKPLLAGVTWSASELTSFAVDVRAYLSTALPVMDNKGEPLQEKNADGVSLEDTSSRLIYLMDDDPLLTEAITLQLQHFGYEVVLFNQLKDLSDALHARTPEVLVVDLGFPEGRFAGAEEIERIRQSGHLNSCIIFISNSSSFESRLHAVRAGGDGYFTKPIDIVALTERIDALVARTQTKRYRVLIIDDDVTTAEYYAVVLRDAGMNVQVLSNPAQILNVMANFRPELLLMDVYMPMCSGVEISKMIRQDNSYLDVPIVFLSSENDLGKQLDAVKAGADDFLTKPISPEFLVSALSTRAERYRALRALIMRDGLTGLYNHTAIKEELVAEISIAGRKSTDLALAMIDLDNFKNVNDTYGHPVGDQVLRTLSRLLRQRLRRSDVIGRYGGEEFVVIFPGITAVTARKVLDEIRVAFKKLQQYSDQGEFSVSFSAGIADLGSTVDADELFDAADTALYSAKHSGKNCIVLANS
ncbi:MAG: diguanylate cyclase [Undibacterium sp.]|uniref:diguanylate cyclase n=1 Tax=Undibacterium sp. TaxID=1914977 RepID=UPI00271606BF|nr:diguanylate cyclase [Undibacterium sp.]MDO8652353.1 diguanylate cyclase [Undibacterium sp.]